MDPSVAGHQPMTSHDNRYVIVFNGEIYNFKELRNELEGSGPRFYSQTDTEVILHAYHTWGKACLDRFNGDFAFVLVDRKKRTIFAARDRLGIKPLYYWYSPSKFVAFASEIKEFTVLPGWRAKINGQRAYDFLVWSQSDHTEETMFDGVRQVQPGGYVECPVEQLERGTTVRRWYELKGEDGGASLDEAGERFRSLFADSVRLRLQADVPIGTSLSGGLDSSSVVCMADRLFKESGAGVQKTFSACSEIAKFDERPFIREVTAVTDTEPHYTFNRLDGLLDSLETMVWHHDEPFLSTSVTAEWSVYKLVAENGVKVVLDGHGADEQLAGLEISFGPHFAGLFTGLAWLQLLKEVRAAKRVRGYGAAYAIRKIVGTISPTFAYQVLLDSTGRTSTHPRWLDLVKLQAEPGLLEALQKGRSTSIREVSHTQLTRISLPKQLHWADRDAMAQSVEGRAPFLDYRLVEFILGLPDNYKLRDGITKVVLRRGMTGVLPEKIRNRTDKMGFVTPEEVWVREGRPRGVPRSGPKGT